MVGIRTGLAHGRDAGRGAALIFRSSNPSDFVALRNVRGPHLAGFPVDLGKAAARRRVGDADELVTSRALNLPARVAGIALERLVAVRAVGFEFGAPPAHSPLHAQTLRRTYAEIETCF